MHIGELFEAYFNRKMPHIERIVCAFRARHFLLMWYNNILKSQARFPDLFQPQSSFLSAPSLQILVSLCDQLILLELVYAEHYPNVPLMLWHFGTDFMEHFFGLGRSFVPDFTYGQLIEMTRHIEARQRILATGKFPTSREKDSNNGYTFDTFINDLTPDEIQNLKSIPSRKCIDKACDIAWKEAAALATQFCSMTVLPLPLNSSDVHPFMRRTHLSPIIESEPAEAGDEMESESSSDDELEAQIEAEPTALEARYPDDDGSGLTGSDAVAFAASNVSIHGLIAKDSDAADEELAAIEQDILEDPTTPVVSRMDIQTLLNPTPSPSLHSQVDLIPSFLPVEAGAQVSRVALVTHRELHQSGINVHSERARNTLTHKPYADGEFKLNHAAHKLSNEIEHDDELRAGTAFQKARYKRWIAQGPVIEWKTGCKVFEALKISDAQSKYISRIHSCTRLPCLPVITIRSTPYQAARCQQSHTASNWLSCCNAKWSSMVYWACDWDLPLWVDFRKA
jgi:hypothetical protein